MKYRVHYSPCGKPNHHLSMDLDGENMGDALIRFRRVYMVQNPRKATPHVRHVEQLEEEKAG